MTQTLVPLQGCINSLQFVAHLKLKCDMLRGISLREVVAAVWCRWIS